VSAQQSTLTNFIGGEFVPPAGEQYVDVVNPADESVIAVASSSGAEDVEAAASAARAAFETWGSMTPAERSARLLRLADSIEADLETLVEVEAIDAGKPCGGFRDFEVPMITDITRFYAGAARLLDGPASGEYVENVQSWLRREPVGVVGQVAPWNYPLLMAIMKIVPALAAGNTVVFKPAPTTPLSTHRLAALSQEILPPGVLNVVLGGDEVGQAIVTSSQVDMVAMTGSVEAGKWIARAAADTLKPVHLELGGKAPVIVFDDADLTDMLEVVAFTGYYNAGQDCTAATRVLAERAVYDRVVAGLADQAAALSLGDPRDEKTTLGPLNSGAQRDRVIGLLDRRAAHNEVIVGGSTPAGPGYFVEPTLVAGLTQTDLLTQEEIFGPVITVQPFDGENQAVSYANGTRYGLAASVWTRDLGRALRVANAVRAGSVWINTHNVLAAEMPFGGYKSSGYGRDLGLDSLRSYTQTKHVAVNLGRAGSM
jgi:betaine-aldehyde dehydrogenase